MPDLLLLLGEIGDDNIKPADFVARIQALGFEDETERKMPQQRAIASRF